MKHIVFLVLLSISSTFCFSQTPSIDKFKALPLYIVLLPEESEIVAWLDEDKKLSDEKKTVLLKYHRQKVSTFNERLPEVIGKHWGYHDVVKYISFTDFAANMKLPVKGRKKYSYIIALANQSTYLNIPRTISDKIYMNLMPFSGPGSEMVFIAGRSDSNRQIARSLIKRGMPSLGELTFSLNMLKTQINGTGPVALGERERVAKKQHCLRERTLLICDDDISDDCSPLQLKSIYPYELKILSRKEFDLALWNSDSTTLHLMVYRTYVDGIGTFDSQAIFCSDDGSLVGVPFKFGTPKVKRRKLAGLHRVHTDHFLGYLQFVKK